jgi:hypothetical protein
VSVELGRMLVKVKVKHGVFCVWRVAMCYVRLQQCVGRDSLSCRLS